MHTHINECMYVRMYVCMYAYMYRVSLNPHPHPYPHPHPHPHPHTPTHSRPPHKYLSTTAAFGSPLLGAIVVFVYDTLRGCCWRGIRGGHLCTRLSCHSCAQLSLREKECASVHELKGGGERRRETERETGERY